MSLFQSAFDTTSSTAGSSSKSQNTFTPTGAPTKSQKRKRPNSLLPKDDKDKLRSTQINLEKLMTKVEKGQIKEKNEGRDSMDVGGSSKPKKAQGDNGGGDKVTNNGEKKYQRPLGKKARFSLPGVGTSTVHPSRMAQVGPTSSSQSDDHSSSEKKKQQAEKRSAITASSSNRPAPAELPLPHDLSASDLDLDLAGGVIKGKDGNIENLTPLQIKMKAKLEGARFRWINEQLYSNPSTEAVEMMKKDPKIFADYHLTHRALTSAWPSPPLPHIIELLQSLPAKTVIADLGCGDAGLARALVPTGKIVLSYDLVGDSGVPGSGSATSHSQTHDDNEKVKKTIINHGEGWVVEADFLEKVPLPGRPGGSDYALPSNFQLQSGPVDGDVQGNASGVGEKMKKKKTKKSRNGKSDEERRSEIVDVVVCCLSLMGINWVGGIYEACRILKQGGKLHIAEVTSRFISTNDFVQKIESFGFSLEDQNSPSTHFTLFSFVKLSAVPLGPARGQKGWKERVSDGEQILRACVYKKR